MKNKNKSLLDYFYESKPSQFPGNKDYVSIFRAFKQFMDDEVHKEVKSMTTRLDNTIYLNDHSSTHVQMVMNKVSSILSDCTYLSAYECFILLVAIEIHDAGHIYNGRDGHEKHGRNLLEKLGVSTIEKRIIGDIAKSHSGKNDPIGSLERKTSISGHDVHNRELAAFLRFADEMADENSRASNYLLENGLIPEESRLYHSFSASLYNFQPDREDRHTIQMNFSLSSEQVCSTFKKGDTEIYLLDEIYTRTLKTFQESLYYNRFVPFEYQFHTINVTIDFLNEGPEPFFDRISYRIEEKGYPSLSIDNIFEYCANQLERHSNKLTGEYVCNCVNSKNEKE